MSASENIENQKAKTDSEEIVFLLSSNRREKYIEDILQTLALPDGAVQHFRYEAQYIESRVKDKIPFLSEEKKELNGIQAAICYLFQEKDDKGNNSWKALYPARQAKILDWYKTGPENSDPVHIYFQVGNYYEPIESLARISHSSEKFVVLFSNLGALTSIGSDKSESAINKFARNCKSDHLKKYDEAGSYSPFYLCIRGLRESDDSTLRRFKKIVCSKAFPIQYVTPKYDESAHFWFYELVEGNRYLLDYSYYLINSPDPKSSFFSIKAKSNLTLVHRKNKISSRYDEGTVQVLTDKVKMDSWSSLFLKSSITNLPISPNNVEALNLSLTIPINLNRSKWRKFFSALRAIRDVSLTVGTVGLTVWATNHSVELLEISFVSFVIGALLIAVVDVRK